MMIRSRNQTMVFGIPSPDLPEAQHNEKALFRE